jgi:hypothetical protein
LTYDLTPLLSIAANLTVAANLTGAAILTVATVTVTACLLLVSRDWRISVASLAVQYIGVFLLVLSNWSLEMAVVKLVAGWMAGAVLGMAFVSNPASWEEIDANHLSTTLFRLLAAALVWPITVTLSPHIVEWFPGIQLEQVYGGTVLIFLGIMQLGLKVHVSRVILGLLTVMAGFEVIYAAVEASALVAGLLAAVNLGIALVGAYMLVTPTMEETA